MDIIYTIFYGVLRIGTQIRRWFKSTNTHHFIEKAIIIGNNSIYDITDKIVDKYNFTGKAFKKISVPLSLDGQLLDLEYHFNGLRYNILYEIETITEDEVLFPLYSLEDETLCPPSNLLSIIIDNQDVTDIIKKYEGPYTNFHNETTKNVDFSTILRLNQIDHKETNKIEIMNSDLDVITKLPDESINSI